MKEFTLYSYGEKIRLEVLKKVTNNQIKVNIKKGGNLIVENEVASICQINGKPDKLYLSFKTDGKNNYLAIADKERGFCHIADWLWENIQGKDPLGNTVGFTTTCQ